MVKRDDPSKKPRVAVEEKQEQDGVILGYLDALLKEVDEASNDDFGADLLDEPVEETANKHVCETQVEADSKFQPQPLASPQHQSQSNDIEPSVDQVAPQAKPIYEAHVNSLNELQSSVEVSRQSQRQVEGDVEGDRVVTSPASTNTGEETSSLIEADSAAIQFSPLQEDEQSEILPNESSRVGAELFRDLSIDDWEKVDSLKIDLHENGRPFWAQSRFECLLFEVGNLVLAAPLVELGCILRINQKFTHIVGSPSWTLGVMQHAGVSYHGVDTGFVIMGNSYETVYKEGLEFMITVNDKLWGLACHKILKSITLEPDEVRWRSKTSVKKWFAGTAVEHMCTVVDVAALSVQLDFNSTKE